MIDFGRILNGDLKTSVFMMCRDDIDYTEIDRNHYEVVLSKRVVDIIKKRVYK